MKKEIYVLLIGVVVLVGSVLFFGREETIQPENVPSAIGTSNWKMFQHEVYPYSVRYPPYGFVQPDTTEQHNKIIITEGGHGVWIEVLESPSDAPGGPYANSYGDISVDDLVDDQSLEQYVISRREDIIQSHEGPGIKHMSGVVEANGIGWRGYQYSFRQGFSAGQDPLVTTLFLVHDRNLYRIMLDESSDTQSAIVSSLEFFD